MLWIWDFISCVSISFWPKHEYLYLLTWTWWWRKTLSFKIYGLFFPSISPICFTLHLGIELPYSKKSLIHYFIYMKYTYNIYNNLLVSFVIWRRILVSMAYYITWSCGENVCEYITSCGFKSRQGKLCTSYLIALAQF